MSDSQGHYNAISRLGDNLLMFYADRQDEVGVFCDLSWYPTESSDNKAPDVMVVFGVPQDRSPPRQSFAQPLEGVGPSVVFELSSKSNRYGDIETKRIWYQECKSIIGSTRHEIESMCLSAKETNWLNKPD